MSEPNGVQDHQVQDHEAQNHEDQSPPVRSPKGEVEGTHIQQSSDSSSDKETVSRYAQSLLLAPFAEEETPSLISPPTVLYALGILLTWIRPSL